MSDNDVKQEVVGAIGARLGHPFLFAFALSWLVFNWDFVVYLLVADEAADARIATLRADYSSPEKMGWYPLLAAFLYVFAAPAIKAIIDSYHSWLAYKTRRVELGHQIRLAEEQQRVLRLDALSAQYKLWQEMRIKAREEIRAALQEINAYVVLGRSGTANLHEAGRIMDQLVPNDSGNQRSTLAQAAALMKQLAERLAAVEQSAFKLEQIASQLDGVGINARRPTLPVPSEE